MYRQVYNKGMKSTANNNNIIREENMDNFNAKLKIVNTVMKSCREDNCHDQDYIAQRIVESLEYYEEKKVLIEKGILVG